jgi:hypothetical protein
MGTSAAKTSSPHVKVVYTPCVVAAMLMSKRSSDRSISGHVQRAI